VLILASASQSRKKLLKDCQIEFIQISSNFDETTIKEKNICNLALELSFQKAKSLSENIQKISFSEEFNDYAVEVSNKIKISGISSAVDLKNHNLNYKIRDHSLAKIPLLLICGKKEVDSNSVTIRRLDSNKQENMGLDQFLKTFSALNKASSN